MEHIIVNPNAAYDKFKDKRVGTKGLGKVGLRWVGVLENSTRVSCPSTRWCDCREPRPGHSVSPSFLGRFLRSHWKNQEDGI